MQGAKRPRPDGAEPQAAAAMQRPPRPPPPPPLDVSHAIAVTAGHGKAAFRSPRSPPGSLSPGSGGRRRQSSKMQGRVCIECGTTTTTQVSSAAGLL